MQYLKKEDPAFYEIYNRFVSVPCDNNIIDAKSRELINVALSASPTCLCQETLKIHVKNAVKHGATEKEILEVYKMVSAIGVHACGVGVPILVEEVEALSKQPIEVNYDDEQARMKQQYIDKKGYFTPFHGYLLDNDRRFFERYADYLSNPLETNLLDPKLKEFIYIAINVSTTHLYAAGIRTHIRIALKLGATYEEIMEVFKLASAQGRNTFYVGIPILKEIFAKSKKAKGAE